MKRFLILLSALFIMISCSDKNDELKGQFVAGCMQGGAPKSACMCIYEKLEEKYTAEEMQGLNVSPTEDFIKLTIESARVCANK